MESTYSIKKKAAPSFKKLRTKTKHIPQKIGCVAAADKTRGSTPVVSDTPILDAQADYYVKKLLSVRRQRHADLYQVLRPYLSVPAVAALVTELEAGASQAGNPPVAPLYAITRNTHSLYYFIEASAINDAYKALPLQPLCAACHQPKSSDAGHRECIAQWFNFDSTAWYEQFNAPFQNAPLEELKKQWTVEDDAFNREALELHPYGSQREKRD